MRNLFVFLGKCIMFIIWVITYIAFIIANLVLCLWYFKLNFTLTYYKYSDGLFKTPKESLLESLNLYSYNLED